jgi:hypothetical protein
MPTGKLIIKRTSPQDVKIRDLYVLIDDKPEINLQYNQSKELDIEPGHHTIRATNRLFSKRDSFKIGGGETIIYEVCNEASGCVMALIWGMGMPFYKLTLKPAREL